MSLINTNIHNNINYINLTFFDWDKIVNTRLQANPSGICFNYTDIIYVSINVIISCIVCICIQ